MEVGADVLTVTEPSVQDDSVQSATSAVAYDRVRGDRNRSLIALAQAGDDAAL